MFIVCVNKLFVEANMTEVQTLLRAINLTLGILYVTMCTVLVAGFTKFRQAGRTPSTGLLSARFFLAGWKQEQQENEGPHAGFCGVLSNWSGYTEWFYKSLYYQAKPYQVRLPITQNDVYKGELSFFGPAQKIIVNMN